MPEFSIELGRSVSRIEREHGLRLNNNTVNANGSAELSVNSTEQPIKPPCILLLEEAERRKKYYIEVFKKDKFLAQGLDNSWGQLIIENQYAVQLSGKITEVRDLVNGPPHNWLKGSEKNILRLCLELLVVYDEIEKELNIPKETWIKKNLAHLDTDIPGGLSSDISDMLYAHEMDSLLKDAVKVDAEINSINLDTSISKIKTDAWAYDDENALYGLVKSFVPGGGQYDAGMKMKTYYQNGEYGKAILSGLDLAPAAGTVSKLAKKGGAKVISAYVKRKTVQEIKSDLSRILDGSSIRKVLNKFGRQALADCLCRGG